MEEEEADDDGNEEEDQADEKAPTEAEGIVTWHGRRRRACIVMQGGPFF